MKKLFALTVSILLFMGMAFQTEAGPLPEYRQMIFKVKKGDVSGTVDVYLANLQKETTMFLLQDAEGRIWFSNYISKKNGYARNFNLNGMPSGHYLVFAANKAGYKAMMLELKGSEVTFFESPDKMIDPPVAALVSQSYKKSGQLIARFNVEDGNKIAVQLANLKYEPTKVRFISVRGGVLRMDEVKGEAGYAKSFNPAGLGDSYGYLYVKTGDDVIVQYFEINEEAVQLGARQELNVQRKKPEFAMK